MSATVKDFKGMGPRDYLVLETLLDEVTRIFNAGVYLDRLAVVDGQLKFKEKLCVFDSIVVPNSLIYPI